MKRTWNTMVETTNTYRPQKPRKCKSNKIRNQLSTLNAKSQVKLQKLPCIILFPNVGHENKKDADTDDKNETFNDMKRHTPTSG